MFFSYWKLTAGGTVTVSNRMQGQSTQELKRRVRIGRIVLIVCWTAIVVAVITLLLYGKSPFVPGLIAGPLGLIVVTIAMCAGAKKINEEIARRSD